MPPGGPGGNQGGPGGNQGGQDGGPGGQQGGPTAPNGESNDGSLPGSPDPDASPEEKCAYETNKCYLPFFIENNKLVEKAVAEIRNPDDLLKRILEIDTKLAKEAVKCDEQEAECLAEAKKNSENNAANNSENNAANDNSNKTAKATNNTPNNVSNNAPNNPTAEGGYNKTRRRR